MVQQFDDPLRDYSSSCGTPPQLSLATSSSETGNLTMYGLAIAPSPHWSYPSPPYDAEVKRGEEWHSPRYVQDVAASSRPPSPSGDFIRDADGVSTAHLSDSNLDIEAVMDRIGWSTHNSGTEINTPPCDLPASYRDISIPNWDSESHTNRNTAPADFDNIQLDDHEWNSLVHPYLGGRNMESTTSQSSFVDGSMVNVPDPAYGAFWELSGAESTMEQCESEGVHAETSPSNHDEANVPQRGLKTLWYDRTSYRWLRTLKDVVSPEQAATDRDLYDLVKTRALENVTTFTYGQKIGYCYICSCGRILLRCRPVYPYHCGSCRATTSIVSNGRRGGFQGFQKTNAQTVDTQTTAQSSLTDISYCRADDSDTGSNAPHAENSGTQSFCMGQTDAASRSMADHELVSPQLGPLPTKVQSCTWYLLTLSAYEEQSEHAV